MSILGTVLALILMLASAGHAQLTDHLKCYKIKDSLKIIGTVDLDTQQFGVDVGCKISSAKLFCVPGTKTNVAVINKATKEPITPQLFTGPDPGDRICYKVKCLGEPADQEVTDQFGTRTVSKFKAHLVCTPAAKGAPTLLWHRWDLLTFTQVSWKSFVRSDDFNSLYGSIGYVEVGIPGAGGYSMLFTNASAVSDYYLPAVGPPGPLNADLLDPTSSASGVFGGEVVALKLNVDWSDAGLLNPQTSELRFGDLRLCNFGSPPLFSHPLNHYTVREILTQANFLLGGDSGIVTIAELHPVLVDLNASFDSGGVSPFAQDHLKNGFCPHP